MIDLTNFRFSRSHQSDYRKCDRLGLLRYWLDGHGYVRAGIKIELATGTLFHNTQGQILEGILKDPDQSFPERPLIRTAIADQTRAYKAEMSVAMDEILVFGLEGDQTEGQWKGNWHRVIARQSTLSEAMVWAWLRCRLPHFLGEYRLISVEGEESSEIAPGLLFMQRKDSTWEHKKSGSGHSLEFKTSGSEGEDFMESWHYDLQQITHLLNFRNKYGTDPKSVFLEVVYKGRKFKGEHVGPLVNGYKMELWDGTQDDEPEVSYDWDYARCRKKGWEKFFVAEEDFGDALKSPAEVWTSEVLDFETLNAHCLHTEILHKPEKIQRWLDQARREMSQVRDNLVILQGIEDSKESPLRSHKLREFVDVAFPTKESQQTCTSFFGKMKCTFLDVCHGDLEIDEIGEVAEFSPRKPHHPGEFKNQ